MKIQALCIFVIFVLSLNIIFANDSEKASDVNADGYFYFQRISATGDPFKLVKNSEQKMVLKYFTVNDNLLSVMPSREKSKKIEDSIFLAGLFNKKYDSIKKGKCCKNIIIRQFGPCNSHSSHKSILPGFPVEIASNHCLEITRDDMIIWRLCSDDKTKIMRLQTKISYNTLKLKAKGKIDKKVLEDFMIENSKDTNVECVKPWNWDSQNQWEGYCQDKSTLQSPIDIPSAKVIELNKKLPKVEISYQFDEVHTVIKKYSNEIQVSFVESAGILKYSVDSISLHFQAHFLSFRFPGEHMIDAKRSSGEVLIHFGELNPNRKTWLTNGLIMSIPLNPGVRNPPLDCLEALNPELWKTEVKKSGQYKPKNAISKKPLLFSLNNLMKKIFVEGEKKTSGFYAYMGSETIPPCKGNIIYLLLDTPLELAESQFKTLRENSLISDHAKEIHARLTQPLQDRKLYKIRTSKLIYMPKLRNYIQQTINNFKASDKAGNDIIKKPIELNAQQLNKQIDDLNKRATKALLKTSPERKKAISDIMKDTGTVRCKAF